MKISKESKLIVVLVILCAFAVFSFIKLYRIQEAVNVAQVQSLVGNLYNTAAIANFMATEQNIGQDSAIVLNGIKVEMLKNYPAASMGGIAAALVREIEMFKPSVSKNVIQFKKSDLSQCYAKYKNSAGEVIFVQTNVKGC